MESHTWLTQEIASLHWYAHYLREALTDPDLPDAGKNPAAAAAKYLVEWEDLIPDTDPRFGYVDDLFVIYLGLDELTHKGGRHGKTYADMQMPSEQTIGQSIIEAKRRFKPFWSFIVKEVGPGFQHIARAIKKDKGHLDQLVEMLGNYIDAFSQQERPSEPIDAASLEAFMAKYQAGRA